MGLSPSPVHSPSYVYFLIGTLVCTSNPHCIRSMSISLCCNIVMTISLILSSSHISNSSSINRWYIYLSFVHHHLLNSPHPYSVLCTPSLFVHYPYASLFHLSFFLFFLVANTDMGLEGAHKRFFLSLFVFPESFTRITDQASSLYNKFIPNTYKWLFQISIFHFFWTAR